jgi:hypothetical protein
VLDAVNLERMGVPTVTLVTPPFVPALAANARMLGLPDLRHVVVPNDYYEETVALRAERIAAVLDEIVAALTS